MKVLANLGRQPFTNRQGKIEKKQAYTVEVTDSRGTHRTILAAEYVETEALAEFNERIKLSALAHSKPKGKTNVGDPNKKGAGGK